MIKTCEICGCKIFFINELWLHIPNCFDHSTDQNHIAEPSIKEMKQNVEDVLNERLVNETLACRENNR